MEEKSNHNIAAWHHLDFKNLVGVNEWQKIQDNFSAVTHIAMRTLDSAGLPITLPSSPPRLCTEILKSHSLKGEVCGSCLPTFLGGKGEVDKNLCYSSCIDTYNFIVPLKIEKGQVLAYVILGPVVLGAQKTKEEYKKFADELNLNWEDLYGAISEIRLVSLKSVQSVIELIQDVGDYFVKSAYKHIASAKMDSQKFVHLLKVFLDVAFQVSGADIGSVMLLDKNKNELTIIASKGLPQEIIRNTRVKIGEGICGTIAKEKTPILIDEGLKDNRIKGYMNRPYLSSAMILPIQVKDRVFGVVNLSTTQSSPVKFDSDDMKLVNRLVDLVGVALH